jgi:ATP-dependent DNA helicase RecQ
MDGAVEPVRLAHDMDKFKAALKKFWGYDSFRPRQEQIVRVLAAGRDVCVVMPTGGGKSLCYQLPAVLSEKRTAVVISPLIALMQDQVAQLRQIGIPAVFLNSSVAETERHELKQNAMAGEYRLMYVSPERVLMHGTADWLKKVPVSFFAIDEAHCISEWGHDFRPEYRQLSKLRVLFPAKPIAAFTASATRQVRHDIVQQLRLRGPLKSVSSFRRENLRYFVREAPGMLQDELLLAALRNAANGNVIVYTPTIARVGEIVDLLEENGIAAIGYHAKMTAAARRENQEKWMTEEVRVLVGTIAFGLGINKANVRAVVRLGLPDSIEQLYQETGRAGRDGLPADCYLLWQRKDNGLRAHFIGQISDEKEKERAWHRYHQMQAFVATKECRQKRICEHFGESAKWGRCDVCDICAGAPAWMASGGAAQTGFRPSASRRIEQAQFEAAPSVPVNEELREFLREWRRHIARQKGIAAFVVMHDATLDELCIRGPKNIQELRGVSGIGEKKCEVYGREILDALERFRGGERASKDRHGRPSNPSAETLELLLKGHTFEQIGQLRGRKVSSVVALVADLVERGATAFQEGWVEASKRELIREAAERKGLDLLKPIKETLGEEVSYEEVRLIVAVMRRERGSVSPPSMLANGSSAAAAL